MVQLLASFETQRLIDLVPTPERWLWKDRIPLESLTSLQGDGSVGKSTLLRFLAARVTMGDLPGDLDRPGNVLWLNVEEHAARDIRPGVDRQGGDLARVVILNDRKIIPSFPRDLDLFEQTVREHDARLIVIDQANTFLETKRLREALYGLARIAEDHGAAIILNRNLNGSTGSAYRAGRGGGILNDVPRAAFHMGHHPDDDHTGRRVLTVIKPNVRGASKLALVIGLDENGRTVIGDEIVLSADAVLQRGGKGTENSALARAVEWLSSYLGDVELPTKEVNDAAKDAGISLPTLGRARAKLGVQSRKISGTPDPTYTAIRLPTTSTDHVDGVDRVDGVDAVWTPAGGPVVLMLREGDDAGTS